MKHKTGDFQNQAREHGREVENKEYDCQHPARIHPYQKNHNRIISMQANKSAKNPSPNKKTIYYHIQDAQIIYRIKALF